MFSNAQFFWSVDLSVDNVMRRDFTKRLQRDATQYSVLRLNGGHVSHNTAWLWCV